MITEDIYRKNPLYKVFTGRELIKLNPDFKNRLLKNQDSFYLVHNENYSLKDVIPIDIQTADCLYSTDQPAQLRNCAVRGINDLLINRLIFDNIIQVFNNNEFVGGPECSFFNNRFKLFEYTATKVATLSLNAIKYSWNFRHLTIDEIMEKLYHYGTMPKNDTISLKISSPDKLLIWLGKQNIDSLAENYNKTPITHKYKYWHYWQHNQTGNANHLLFKLYISPSPKETPEVFSKVISLCNTHSVSAFKIGSTSLGIHRPDKFILYFKDQNSAFLFASYLVPILSMYNAQGVPFTFPLTENGILSFGIDPSEEYNISYRIYISRIIAETLKLYSTQYKHLNIHHILFKLNLLGIATNKWNIINTYHTWNY
jgi:hypothetical protein